MFGLFLEQKGLADQFRFGGEADGTPAAPWGWEDLDLWLVPRYGPRRRNRRDDLNNRRSNRSGQLFEAQLAGDAVEEFNRTRHLRSMLRLSR